MGKIDISKVGKIDISSSRTISGGGDEGDPPVTRWSRKVLGDLASLSQFGVNLLELQPGGWSSDRHWHSHEDEFIYVLEGEVVLATESGEMILRSGDCAGFKAGMPDAHHLQNRSQLVARVLEIGSRLPELDVVEYPDLGRRKTPAGEEDI